MNPIVWVIQSSGKLKLFGEAIKPYSNGEITYKFILIVQLS